jgi:hypothetical protein
MTELLTTEYLTDLLPDHITDSTYFQNWRALFPTETIFLFYSNYIIPNLDIKSQTDFDNIVNADYILGFNTKTRVEILGKLEDYWNNDPNSAPIRLPEPDKSCFGNQIRDLFTKKGEMILVSCMVNGYIELFEYMYKKECENAVLDPSYNAIHVPSINAKYLPSFNTSWLLYHAVSSGQTEMVKRCIEVGLEITSCLVRPIIQGNNIEILHILFEAKPDLINLGHTEIYFCEEASIEMFRVFLDYYINKSGKDPVKLTLLAVKKLDKLKELMFNYDICNIKNLSKLYICELFMECIKNSVNIETVLFIEEHFSTTLKEIKTKPESEYFGYLNINYICDNVIINDNLELYNHMRQSGFRVDDRILYLVVRERCIKITPGLVKKHIAEGYHAENHDSE